MWISDPGTRKKVRFSGGGWGSCLCERENGRRWSAIWTVFAVRRGGVDVTAQPHYSHCAPVRRNSLQNLQRIPLLEENDPSDAAGPMLGCSHGKPRLGCQSREVSHPFHSFIVQ